MKATKYHLESNNQLFYSVAPKGDIITRDKKGIVLYKIPYTSKHDYYPVYVAEYALGSLNKHVNTGNEKYKEQFLKHVDWLVENITDKRDFGVWEHHYTLPYYDFKIPWVHGMAQGLAVSALLKAYQLTNSNIYLEVAKKAYGSFEKNIEEGGVRYTDANGDTWLEEYAILPAAHILNGFIFILFSIYDYYIVTKDKKALRLWNKEIKTLEKNLKKYDTGYWSQYNLIHKHPAKKSYHTLHIKQLKVLYKLTGKEIFKEYAKRWEKYLNNPLSRGRANIKRIVVHLGRHGIKGSINQYFVRRRWLKT